MISWLLAASGSAIVGLALVPALAARGLADLAEGTAPSPPLVFTTGATGAVGGAVAVAAMHRSGSWWWLPALLVWAYTLCAAAVCDVRTQRIPTPLVRQGAVTTAVLEVAAAAITRDWPALAITLVACAAAGLILAVCWRFAGVGFGDVRMALLGGLGLGHASHRSLTFAAAAFIVLTACQALWTFGRTRNRHATFPYGPALAVGFLIAAAG